MNVTQKEIVQRLRCAAAATNPYSYLFNLADEIEANGIAQPQPSQVQALIAEIEDIERKCFCDGDELSEILDKYRGVK